ncbi:MAG: hypothetical protein JXO22_13600 [Phycisphaerae bacterium]|nr:hypothetical protein [Phycisphaerae bacterium]
MTRSQLYDRVVDQLLGRHIRRRPRYPFDGDMDLAAKRTILERIALALLLPNDRSRVFTEYDLSEQLNLAVQAARYGNATAPWATALREDLLQNSGLLRGHCERGFFFVHPTLQDFLAASALARRINASPGG